MAGHAATTTRREAAAQEDCACGVSSSPLTSGGGEEEKKGPGHGGGKGDGGAADLEEERGPAHVLSGTRQKKGARAAVGDQAALQRGIRDGVSVHDGLQHQRSLLEGS